MPDWEVFAISMAHRALEARLGLVIGEKRFVWDWICVRDKPLTTEYLTRSRVFSHNLQLY